MYDVLLMMKNTARCQCSRRNVSIPGFLHKYRMSIQVLVKNSGMLIIQSAPVHRGRQEFRNTEIENPASFGLVLVPGLP